MMFAARAQFGLVVLFLGIFPLATLFFSPWSDHDAERVAQLLVYASAALALTFSIGVRRPQLKLPVFIAAGILIAVLLALVSITRAGVRTWAMVEAAMFVGMIVCAITVAWVVRERGDRDCSLAVIFAVAPYSLLILALSLAAVIRSDSLLRWELFAGYSNFRFFNHVQTVFLPLLVIASLDEALSRSMRRVAFSSAALNVAFILFTAARATTAGLLIGCAIAALLCDKAGRNWSRRFLQIAVMGALIYGLVYVVLPSVAGLRSDVSTAELAANQQSVGLRFQLWRLAIGYALQSPWFGIGPMHYAHFPNSEAAHPHNFSLQLAAEWGIPFFVLLAVGAAYALYRAIRLTRAAVEPRRAMIGAGLIVSFAATLVDSNFSGNFVMPMSQTWIALMLGWLAAWMRGEQTWGRVRTWVAQPWMLFAAATAAVLITLFPLWVIRNQVTDLPGYLDQVRASIVRNDHDSPRFWSHGWF